MNPIFFTQSQHGLISCQDFAPQGFHTIVPGNLDDPGNQLFAQAFAMPGVCHDNSEILPRLGQES